MNYSRPVDMRWIGQRITAVDAILRDGSKRTS
jgi:hypothetical protein